MSLNNEWLDSLKKRIAAIEKNDKLPVRKVYESGLFIPASDGLSQTKVVIVERGYENFHVRVLIGEYDDYKDKVRWEEVSYLTNGVERAEARGVDWKRIYLVTMPIEL